MKKIREIKDPSWVWLENPSAKENKKAIELELEKEDNGSIGKYQFFSDDKKILIELGKNLLVKYNLFNAKVPASDIPIKADKGFGFLLCIYDTEPRFKQEFRKYADEKEIKYRYWKSDNATLKGEYSEGFLKTDKGRTFKKSGI